MKKTNDKIRSPLVAPSGRIAGFFTSPSAISVYSSIISIIFGLLVGLIILLIIKPADAFEGFARVLVTAFTDSEKLGRTIFNAVPMICTGLAVGFAFKTGLFNIGASGQYTLGMFCSLFGGLIIGAPWWICLILAVIGGALWGAIPGIFKAFFNINEVITSIMFNWIGLYLVNLLIYNIPGMTSTLAGYTNYTSALGEAALIPKLGLDKLFDYKYFNIGLFIVIGVAVIIEIVLNKTVFGYELKACGLNKNASRYAGISAKRNIILSMIISGALAGLGGGIYYLSGITEYEIVQTILPMGFNGISVALLANSSPIGILFSAYFISHITTGGGRMQGLGFSSEIISIIISVIIYVSAFALLFKNLIFGFVMRKADKKLQSAGKKTNSAKTAETDHDLEICGKAGGVEKQNPLSADCEPKANVGDADDRDATDDSSDNVEKNENEKSDKTEADK